MVLDFKIYPLLFIKKSFYFFGAGSQSFCNFLFLNGIGLSGTIMQDNTLQRKSHKSPNDYHENKSTVSAIVNDVS